MRVPTLEAHRLWASSYDSTPNPVLALEMRIVKQLLCPTAPMCFIDVACGTGRWMTYVRHKGAKIFGIDLCAEMLAEAARKPELMGRSVLAEASNIPFRTRIADIVLCSFAVAYLPNLNRSLIEMARILKPGGKLIVSDLHPTAVSAGWRRSFRSGNLVLEITHFRPSVDELRIAAERAGLQAQMQIESSFGESERPLFALAGKEDQFQSVSSIPAVWIGVWNKR